MKRSREDARTHKLSIDFSIFFLLRDMATLRESMKQGITAAIAAGSAPRPPSKGRGLMLSIDGQRRGLRLMDDRGDLTAAGDYYYEAMGGAPPPKQTV